MAEKAVEEKDMKVKDMEVKDVERKASVMMLETMETYQQYIKEARAQGATKKSYDRVQQELFQYLQIYPIPSLAVSLCVKAFEQAAAEQMKEKAKPDVVKECGRIMYWNTLPKHINRECIRDFIACVVHGMAVGSIPGPEAGRLLYGAQVAQQALPAVRKWRKNSSKTSSKASAKCTQSAPKPHQKSPEPTPVSQNPATI
jgi:hypothetical protein